MKTISAIKITCAMIKYCMHSMPNMSHQRCGAAKRHVWTDVYRRIFEVRNQAITRTERSRESLSIHFIQQVSRK